MEYVMCVWSYFLILLSGVPGTYQDQPHNIAVKTGNDAHFYFVVPDGFIFITWTEHVSKVSGEEIVQNGAVTYAGDASIKARFSLTEASNGTDVISHLVLSNVVAADGGRYNVMEVVKTDIRNAQLIVLDDVSCSWTNADSSLSNSYVVSGDVINVTCSLSYSGEWAPIISCSAASSGVSGWATVDKSSPSMASYLLTADVTSDTSPVVLSCKAAFANPTTSQYLTDYATNIPSYTSSWTSGSIDKYYAATSLSISPQKSEYASDDVITCIASGGNPSPTYSWSNVATSAQLASTSSLTVTSSLSGVSVRCTATTTVRGTSHTLTDDVSLVIGAASATTKGTATITTTTTTTLGPADNNIFVASSTTTKPDDTNNSQNALQTQYDTVTIVIISVSISGLSLLILIATLLAVYCLKKDAVLSLKGDHATRPSDHEAVSQTTLPPQTAGTSTSTHATPSASAVSECQNKLDTGNVLNATDIFNLVGNGTPPSDTSTSSTHVSGSQTTVVKIEPLEKNV